MTAPAGGLAAGATGGGASGTSAGPAGPSAPVLTITTVVTGPTPAAREAAIHAAIAASPDVPTAVILEGLASANSPLADCAPQVTVVRIAPGCLCCAGNLVLRVSLNRLLRRPPARLLISLANAEHAGQLHGMLENAPYVGLLTLGANWHIHLT
ncbi:GTPase [Pseudoduganella rivuli]|uniref:GTPase n=1 Tax=Pseudoduganella rivuli TaxID=2666085 RepID=UPI001E565A73|nr:GTPase [Pseudoduganella rivuli]